MLVFFAVLCTGCSSPIPSDNSFDLNSPETPSETGSDSQLEITSPWTGGGGKDAMDSLIGVYEMMNPGVEVINAADSGLSYPELVAEFDQRLIEQQPFDSWHVHPGDQVLNYVILGQIEPVTRLFEDQGLDQVMPPLLVEQITISGEIYSIPMNIHRSNVLWYNPEVFQENHLTPPETIEEFFEVAEVLESQGIIPLAVGARLGFEVGHIFESVLLATFGPEDYLRLFQAETTMWEDSRASIAIDTLGNMLAYTNENFLETSLGDAAQMVADGEAGMTIMGDWVEGHLKNRGYLPNKDFGWIAAPGTEGTFIWISDGFVLATGAKNREAALAWLEVVGSIEGQDAFNPIKGSIPARLDTDKSLYDEYLQWSTDQFDSRILVPSVVHGSVGTEEYLVAYGDALTAFSKDLDSDKLLQSLRSAAVLLGQ
jgi:glucose/mannose transport system substrate-binding protein